MAQNLVRAISTVLQQLLNFLKATFRVYYKYRYRHPSIIANFTFATRTVSQKSKLITLFPLPSTSFRSLCMMQFPA